MDLTPGSTARNSRSFSAEAAQYDAQANDAEAQIRRLESKIKAMQAKAEQARLQKQQTETACEEAFQAERQERQAEVRNSITDHHIEGIKKSLEDDQHLVKDLKKVASDDLEEGENAVTFVSTLVLGELVGRDGEFLQQISKKVLELMAITKRAAGNGSAGQSFNISPYNTFKESPVSPAPTQPPAQTARVSYGRYGSPELGTETTTTIGHVIKAERHEIEDNEPAKTRYSADEHILENQETENVQGSRLNLAVDTAGQALNILETKEFFRATNTADFVGSSGEEDTSLAEEVTLTSDRQGVKVNGDFTEPYQTVDHVEVDEYGSIEQDNMTEVNSEINVFSTQEPLDPITGMLNVAKLKRHSTEMGSGMGRPSSPATNASSGRQTFTSKETAFSAPQTPEPGTPSLKKVVTPALRTLATSKKKQPIKRKRRDSEATTATEASETLITPAPKKSKAKAIEGEENNDTPATKSKKAKPKEEGSLPLRVQQFIDKVKTLSPEAQASALVCGNCHQLPPKPRLSHCLHMYCEKCWKNIVKTSGSDKGTEQSCKREGCQGRLGKATIVKPELDILNLRNDIWTGHKSNGMETTQVDRTVDGDGGAMEVDDRDTGSEA